MFKKRRGVIGTQVSIVLIAVVIVASSMGYIIINSGFLASEKTNNTIDEGLSSSSGTIQKTGKITGSMCIPASTGCGPHTSLNSIAIPIKMWEGGGSADLSANTASIRLTTNSVYLDNIYGGIVNPENDFIFVADSRNDRAQKFSESGDHLLTFDDGGGLDRPDGIAVDFAGNIYVADRADDEITIFDSNGNTLFSFGGGTLNNPEGVDIGPSGQIYVADSNNDAIRVYDVGGNLLSTIGTATLNRPSDVAVDNFENIYVADRNDDEIEVFDSNGNQIRSFSGGGILNNPDGIDVRFSRVYVGDRSNDRVVVFDTKGNLIFTFDDGGNLNNPEGIEVDYDGNIYVADRGDDEVVVFDSTGNKIRTIGSGSGSADGQFDEPEDVALQTFDNNSVSIIGLAAANNLVTSTIDSTFGATVTQTTAFIYWHSSILQQNSLLEQGERAEIIIAFTPKDRPSSLDIVKMELLVHKGSSLTVERMIPNGLYGVTELG